jgi:hypothetical protein
MSMAKHMAEDRSAPGGLTSNTEKKTICLSCNQEIQKPRVEKGKVIQKFCSRKCRLDYHNAPKRKQNLDAFVGELKGLLEKMTDLLKRYHLQR